MVRTILTAKGNTLTLALPDSFVGKQIEVIAFTLDDTAQPGESQQPKQVSFTVLNVPDKSFKFNREEANER